jgi:hypothetical protein
MYFSKPFAALLIILFSSLGILPSLIQPTHAAAPTSGLVGHWGFNEGSGTTASDSTGNENTGTLTNGPTWNTGKVGQALIFDGTDDRVDIPNASNFALSTFTISAWARKNGTNFDGIFSHNGLPSSGHYHLRFESGGSIYCLAGDDSNGYLVIVPVSGAIAGWHHLVCTFNNGILSAYADGVLIGTDNSGSYAAGVSGTTEIGRIVRGGGTQLDWTKGSIDEVRVYNRALSSTEISDLYAAESGGVATTPPPAPPPTTPPPAPPPPPSPTPTPPPPAPPPSSGAGTYYVATNGSDSNPGTLAQPFSTIFKGMQAISTAGPGSTLYIRGGAYKGWTALEANNINPVGTNWTTGAISVKNYPGETVTITSKTTSHIATTIRAHYLIFDGESVATPRLIFDGERRSSGVAISGTENPAEASHVRMTNVEVKNAIGNGIITAGGHHNEFLNCKIHHNGTSQQFDHGFYIVGPDNLVENCDIFSNTGFGVHIYGSEDTNPNARNIIRGNRIYANRNGMIVSSGNANVNNGTAHIVYNNLIWGHLEFGIWVDYEGGGRIFNNTIIGKPDWTWGGIFVGGRAKASLIENNIAYRIFIDAPNPQSFPNGGPVHTVRNNLFRVDSFSDSGVGTIKSGNLINVDPLWVDLSNLNFHLKAGSPAIDKGIANGLTSDFDNCSRPVGLAIDIGAYEYSTSCTAAPAPPPSQTPTPSTTPTPLPPPPPPPSPTPTPPPTPPISSGLFSATFNGITQDFVGTTSLTSDGKDDYYISLRGLRSIPTRIRVVGNASDVWESPFNGINFVAALRNYSSGNAELYLSAVNASSNSFTVQVWYADGSSDSSGQGGSTPLIGDLNSDRIINSLDWSLMNASWLTNNATADLNKDGTVNSIDFSIMNGNWLKTN